MAKLGFKDIIMKYLKKDESTPMGGKFIVRFKRGDQKPVQAIFDTKAQADAYEKEKIRMGFEIVEDAPANATGTAVAGTGDDSSTVVVKKKKDQQKKLMKRMGITEAIDRAIPDLEYPKDEIRERVNQLKDFASKQEDLDAQPQDKDVKKVKGTQPKKYYKTLDKDTKKKRAAFFKKKAGTYKKSDDDDDYKAAPGDEKAKTKPSTFTKKFKQMYGDNYGYTAMHAKPVAKLNPLRRKDEGR